MRTNRKRSRKSNGVSWAPGADLCQVRLFSAEDCPAKVGLKCQDDLQAKTSGVLPSDPTGYNELPPGFERGLAVNKSGLEPSYVPQVQWKCPPKFVLSQTWLVAAGEESEEVKHQKLREMRVLEAVYPRSSAIPHSSYVSLESENEYYDDSRTPIVPITPIEDEEPADTVTLSDVAPSVNTTTISSPPPSSLSQVSLPSESHPSKCNSSFLQSLGTSQPPLEKRPDRGADVLAATSAALATIMKSNEEGSLIDTDLLMKIFSDPKMIRRLMNNGQPTSAPSVSTKTTVSASISDSRTVSPSVPLPSPALDLQRPVDENSFHIPNGLRTTVNTTPRQQDAPQVSRFQQVVTPPVSMSTPEPFVSLPRLSDGNLFSVPNQVRSSVNAASVQPNTAFAVQEPAPPVKDVNYYKNLIRQHGGEKEENKDYVLTQNGKNYYKNLIRQHGGEKEENKDYVFTQNGKNYFHLGVQNFKLGQEKPKNSKPCAYFKTSKGCRNGASCPYQHDVSLPWQSGNVMESYRAKRMKLNGEINGVMLV